MKKSTIKKLDILNTSQLEENVIIEDEQQKSKINIPKQTQKNKNSLLYQQNKSNIKLEKQNNKNQEQLNQISDLTNQNNNYQPQIKQIYLQYNSPESKPKPLASKKSSEKVKNPQQLSQGRNSTQYSSSNSLQYNLNSFQKNSKMAIEQSIVQKTTIFLEDNTQKQKVSNFNDSKMERSKSGMRNESLERILGEKVAGNLFNQIDKIRSIESVVSSTKKLNQSSNQQGIQKHVSYNQNNVQQNLQVKRQRAYTNNFHKDKFSIKPVINVCIDMNQPNEEHNQSLNSFIASPEKEENFTQPFKVVSKEMNINSKIQNIVSNRNSDLSKFQKNNKQFFQQKNFVFQQQIQQCQTPKSNLQSARISVQYNKQTQQGRQGNEQSKEANKNNQQDCANKSQSTQKDGVKNLKELKLEGRKNVKNAHSDNENMWIQSAFIQI